jgi:hypothetical protein
VTEPLYRRIEEIIAYHVESGELDENISVSKFVELLIFQEVRNYNAMGMRMRSNSLNYQR